MRVKFAICSVVLGLMMAAPVAAAPVDADHVPGELLVKFKPGRATQAKSVLHSRKGLHARQFQRTGIEQWRLAPNTSLDDTLAALRASGTVEFAEPNYRREPRAAVTAADVATSWALGDFGLADACAAFSATPAPIIVAVVDDSVDIEHEAIKPHVWSNAAETLDGTDTDNNGFVDDVHGWDFLNGDNNPSADPRKDEGHGTSVAGAALSVGCGSWRPTILPLKFSFDVASELAAFDYAIANGARIVNASWGGPQFSWAEASGVQALQDAGVLLVAAAGNYALDNDLVPDYPSGLPHANVIAVAASDQNGNLARYNRSAASQYGAASVDLAAPGIDLPLPSSSVDTDPLFNLANRTYELVKGTSFSAPFVAGVAALVGAQYPAASAREIKGRLLASVTTNNASLESSMQGRVAVEGRLNAVGALAVMPASVLVYAGHSVHDASGDKLWQPGEEAILRVIVENVWELASGVTATLISDTPDLVTVLSGDASIDSIPPDGKVVVAFTVRRTEATTGYQRATMRLDLTPTGGSAITRRFPLHLGVLGASGYQGSFTSTDHVMQVLAFRPPLGNTPFDVVLTSPDGADLDLFVRRGGPLNPYCYQQADGCNGQSTWVAATAAANETITVNPALTNVYYAVVYNYNGAVGTRYTLSTRARQTRSTGGGGAELWLLPLLWLVARRGVIAMAVVITATACSAPAVTESSGVDAGANKPATSSYRPGELLVTFATGTNPDDARRVLEAEGAVVLHSYHSQTMFHVRLPEHLSVEQALPHFRAVAGVVAVEPNWIRSKR